MFFSWFIHSCIATLIHICKQTTFMRLMSMEWHAELPDTSTDPLNLSMYSLFFLNMFLPPPPPPPPPPPLLFVVPVPCLKRSHKSCGAWWLAKFARALLISWSAFAQEEKVEYRNGWCYFFPQPFMFAKWLFFLFLFFCLTMPFVSIQFSLSKVAPINTFCISLVFFEQSCNCHHLFFLFSFFF